MRVYAAALCVTVAATVLSAQTFRGGTRLVSAETQVDENGRVLAGLSAADFVIFDEDRSQPIAHFSPESGAIRLLLLLDASGSMEPAARSLARSGLAAMSVLHPDDLVGLMTFDKKGTLRVPLTPDHAAVIAGVNKLLGKPFSGGTDLYRAASDAANYLAHKGARVPGDAPNVILLLTDNAARADTTEESALRDIWKASASLDGLIVSSVPMWPMAASSEGTKMQDVRRLSLQSGGDTRQSPDVESELRGMLERSRARYTLFYAQPDSAPGVFHHIRVELSEAVRAKHPAARIRARSGYYSD